MSNETDEVEPVIVVTGVAWEVGCAESAPRDLSYSNNVYFRIKMDKTMLQEISPHKDKKSVCVGVEFL